MVRRPRLRHLENYRWSSYPGHVAKANMQEFMRYEVLKRSIGVRPRLSTIGSCRARLRVYIQTMPRPPRIDFPDALYHVTSRGNGRATIFHDEADCEALSRPTRGTISALPTSNSSPMF